MPRWSRGCVGVRVISLLSLSARPNAPIGLYCILNLRREPYFEPFTS